MSPADGRVRVYRRRGERYSDANIVEQDRWGGGPSVMVWAGIMAHSRTELVFVAGNLNAQRYRDEIVEAHVFPFLNSNQNAIHFQHDNARPHVARIVTQYLQQHDVHVLPWPAFSPDLFPIEHAWDELDRCVRQRPAQAHNVHKLAEALAEEWRAIPQGTWQRLVGSMRCCILACISKCAKSIHF